ncbi:GTP-binding protein [Limnoraphis robusta]|uniref:GTP-binding protein n=1 Tax=Limnoraphis robusta CCNP1315 TaxID=3110306 RepID=A0ABU5U3H3_9CYAN|nr:GTP-binding protein [Limnoraphis robusta]MEA5521466.1 GTP-binding protein [Limnoraphis robusta CCNP1315]MEA5546451.1 GTP-binding protein [Limnoraphis robusta CCNP1324]
MIIAVTGPPGAGKTHWIREQISQTQQQVRYFNPGEGSVVIDGTCIASDFPEVEILTEGQEFELFNPEPKLTTYIELPWHLDLSSVQPLLEQLNAKSVVLGNENIVESLTEIHTSQVQIHRSLLSGEILDWSSLAVFWFELIKGAYGEVIRAKGIFDIVSGESIYGDFVAGTMNQEFVALDVPLWLAGRPQRFSGLEIVGFDLNKAELSQTLKDCFLPESQISYYQQQIQTTLETEEVNL